MGHDKAIEQFRGHGYHILCRNLCVTWLVTGLFLAALRVARASSVVCMCGSCCEMWRALVVLWSRESCQQRGSIPSLEGFQPRESHCEWDRFLECVPCVPTAKCHQRVAVLQMRVCPTAPAPGGRDTLRSVPASELCETWVFFKALGFMGRTR